MLSKNIVNWTTMAAISGILASCATDRPHNDVLIFGTSTKLALDVSAPVQNAGIPEFTLGYKRQEAVWMPLKPSDAKTNPDKSARASEAAEALTSCYQTLALTVPDLEQRRTICMAVVLPSDKYVSYASGLNSDKGGSGGEIDTYSVFASFGASGNLSSSGASGNLAQFFATGIAAQRLGANPAVGLALNTKSDNAVAQISNADAALAKVSEAAAKERQTNQLKAEALKPCLTTATKAIAFKADSDLGPYSTGLPTSTAAENLIKVLSHDSASLTKAEILCK